MIDRLREFVRRGAAAQAAANRVVQLALCATADSTYAVALDGQSITFSPCGVTSHSPGDVAHHYCAVCHTFVEHET